MLRNVVATIAFTPSPLDSSGKTLKPVKLDLEVSQKELLGSLPLLIQTSSWESSRGL